MNPLLLEYLKTVVRIVYLWQAEMTLFTEEYAEIMHMYPAMPGYTELREWVLRNFYIDREGSYLDARFYEAYPLTPQQIEANLQQDKEWRDAIP